MRLLLSAFTLLLTGCNHYSYADLCASPTL